MRKQYMLHRFAQEIAHHIPIIFQITKSVLCPWCFLSFSFNLLCSIFLNVSSNLRRLISLQTYSWIIYYYILYYYCIIILAKTLVLPDVLSDISKIKKLEILSIQKLFSRKSQSDRLFILYYANQFQNFNAQGTD